MRSRHILIMLAASVAAAAFSSPAWQGAGEQAQLKDPPIRALSTTAKLAMVKTKFGLSIPPRGVLDTLTLTVNRPVVPNKGSLRFKGYNFFSDYSGPGIADYGAYGDPYVGNVTPMLTLNFFVAKPNKRHLITFYVSPYVGVGNLRFEPAGFPAQTEDMLALRESKTAFVLITPKKTGNQYIVMKSPGGIRFHSVEIDVLD